MFNIPTKFEGILKKLKICEILGMLNTFDLKQLFVLKWN